MIEVEQLECESFLVFTKNFLGNIKTEKCDNIFDGMGHHSKTSCCNLNKKLHYLHSHIVHFQHNLVHLYRRARRMLPPRTKHNGKHVSKHIRHSYECRLLLVTWLNMIIQDKFTIENYSRQFLLMDYQNKWSFFLINAFFSIPWNRADIKIQVTLLKSPC